MRHHLIVLLLLGALHPGALAAPFADVVVRDGTIYTANARQEVVEAVAWRGDTIVYTGDSAGAAALIGNDTQVIELQGRMALPGLHDAHLHPVMALERMTCALPERSEMDLPGIVTELRSCLRELGDDAPQPGGWITVSQFNGYGADSPAFLGQYPTIRAGLDAVSDRHAIFLVGADGHVYAVNSYALEHGATLAGQPIAVNAASLDGELRAYRDYFQLDERGEPAGIVKDAGAYDLFDYDKEPVESLIARAADINHYFHSAGITSAQEAWAKERDVAVMEGLARAGQLGVRMSLAVSVNAPRTGRDYEASEYRALLATLKATRERLAPLDRLKADGIKLMVDGVIEYPTQTAAQKQHYLQASWGDDGKVHYTTTAQDCPQERAPCEGEPFNYGILEFEPATLDALVADLDQAGFTLHFHALGDRAVDTVLGAVEKARVANPGSRAPHNVAHLQQVDPADVPRFGKAGLFITPTMSWLAPWLEYDVSVIPYIDQHDDVTRLEDLYRQDTRYMRRLYPLRSIRDGGAVLAAGSDAPVDGPLPRPFTDIMYGLMRGGWVEDPRGGDARWVSLNPDERLPIEDLLDAYTINGARALGQADITGSLEPGKKADLVIINQDIIAAAHTMGAAGPEKAYTEQAYGICDHWWAEHCRTRVLATFIDGQRVYEASGFSATRARP